MDARRRWIGALVVVLVVGLAAVAVLRWREDDDGAAVSATTSTEGPATTSTSAPTTATTAPPSSTTTQGDDVPGAVAVISAGPGGGSGEIRLDWNAVAGSVGYRVLRADDANGPFSIAADVNATTGAATAAADVVNIQSEQHSYIPAGGPLETPDPSPSFQYVEASGVDQRCFRVIAYNGAGDGVASVVVCGSPP